MITFVFLIKTIWCDPSSEPSRPSKPYGVTSHLNHLVEMVQMRGHNICFYAKLTKIIPNYYQIFLLIYSCGFILPSPMHLQTKDILSYFTNFTKRNQSSR